MEESLNFASVDVLEETPHYLAVPFLLKSFVVQIGSFLPVDEEIAQLLMRWFELLSVL